MYSSLLQSNLTFRFDISIHAANFETVNCLTNVLHACRNKIVIHQSWPNWVMSSSNNYIKTTAPTFKLIIRYDVNYDWRLFQQYFPIYIACHGHIFGRRPVLIINAMRPFGTTIHNSVQAQFGAMSPVYLRKQLQISFHTLLQA